MLPSPSLRPSGLILREAELVPRYSTLLRAEPVQRLNLQMTARLVSFRELGDVAQVA